MTATKNAEIESRLYRLFNEGKLDEASGLAKDAIRVDVVPFGMVFEGRDGFRQFMSGFKTAFPDLTISVDKQVVNDRHIVSECTWNGTHDGPLGTPAGAIPATHKRVSGARFCEVWDIEDGRITRLANYQDLSSWMRQLGLERL
jgi:steroid delta-isomerase-like uncharacterized protein